MSLAGSTDAESVGLVEAWQFHVQGHAQPLGADVIEESRQDGHGICFLRAVLGTPVVADWATDSGPAIIEQGRRMLAMIAGSLGELVEDPAFLFLARFAVASLEQPQVDVIRVAHEKPTFLGKILS